MLRIKPAQVNRTNRKVAMQNLTVSPSPLQVNLPARPSDYVRSHTTSMEMGSTCRRNPRIATVR